MAQLLAGSETMLLILPTFTPKLVLLDKVGVHAAIDSVEWATHPMPTFIENVGVDHCRLHILVSK